MKMNHDLLLDNDISQSIHTLSTTLSRLKTEYFKSVFMYRKFDRTIITKILADINSFLSFWEGYADSLGERIKTSKGKENIRTIDYQYVKEFIYANYDYAAVLQFTDGVIKGIDSKRFDDPDDISDFKNHVLAKAFNDRPDTVGGLLDSVLLNGSGLDVIVNTISMDVKLYDSIRNYGKLFDKKSRVELYKSIEKVFEFLTLSVEKFKADDPDGSKMFVSMVNNTIDVISYSLAAYATRIYIIGRYAYPFITNSIVSSFAESLKYGEELQATNNPVTVFNDADNALYKDIKNVEKFLEVFSEFLKMIGVGNNSYMDIKDIHIGEILKSSNGNPFYSKLIGNDLHVFLIDHDYSSFSINAETNIEEMYHNIKQILYNNKQGIQGISSPKQELLQVIRTTKSDDTLKGQQTLAEDLFMYTIPICMRISTKVADLLSWNKSDIYMRDHNLHLSGKVLGIVQMLSDFYAEYVNAVINKARDIETKINELKSANVNDIMKGFKVKIPSLIKQDTDNIQLGVPETTRVPLGLMETYELITMEGLEMYDEYVKSLPDFQDDLYFSEALNISSLINSIISKLRSLWERIKAFINNKYFQLAVDWVTKHEKELLELNFNNVSMDILPYKENITLPRGFNNLQNNLSKFDNNVLSNQESLKKYISTLYPSETIYKWFSESKGTSNEDKEKNNGAVMYRNLILFQNESNVTADQQKEIQITAGSINKYLKDWIETIKGSKQTLEDFKKISDEIENSINSVKSKIVNITNNQNKTTTNKNVSSPNNSQQTSTDGNPPSSMEQNQNNDGNNKTATTNITNNQQTSESNNGDIINTALTDIMIAVTRIWGSLTPIFIEYMKNEYSYIKTAWSIGKRNN